MKILILIAAFGTALVLPHTAQALTDGERDTFTLLLMGPKDNPVKTCAASALQLNTGLTAKWVAHASDDDVEKELMDHTTAEGFRAERVREVSMWKQTHKPAKVALMNFNYCAQVSNVDLRLEAAGDTCFSLAGVPALAETLKLAGHPKEYTAEKMAIAYGKQIPEDFMHAVVDSVYARNADADHFEVHRQVLSDCIRNTRPLVSDEEVLKEYERLKAVGTKEYHVMHIMVGDQDVAEQLVARLNKGEAFSDLAKTYSLDPGSSKKGGDLGWSAPSSYTPAFAAAVTATAPGSYTTTPVHTPFGWHIVKVDAVRAMNVPAFQQVKERLRISLEAASSRSAGIAVQKPPRVEGGAP